jgi:hypothetical protein
MISEVVNALCITYIATEYTLASCNSTTDGRQSWWKIFSRAPKQQHLIGIVVIVVLINILDRVSGAAEFANEMFQGVLHVPKVILCALVYVIALYIDCRRYATPLRNFKTFSCLVGAAFCRVAPAYPILAVMISFVFMFVISAFEALKLPLEWLNMPIYYGTLYGPFSVIYYIVKKRALQDYYSLPP